MEIRSKMTQGIANKAIVSFCRQKRYQAASKRYKVSELILAETKHQMIAAMNQWNGIDVKKLKVYKAVPYKTFRQYFVVAKVCVCVLY